MSPRLRVNESFTAIRERNAQLELQNGDLQQANGHYRDRAIKAEARVGDLLAERDETLNELGSALTEVEHLKSKLAAQRDREKELRTQL